MMDCASIKELLNSINKYRLHDHIKDVVIKLHDLGYDGIQTDTLGKTPLHYAASCGYEDVVLNIVNLYKDIDIKDDIFSKPLSIGSQVGDTIFSDGNVQSSRLIKVINHQNAGNRSPLFCAVERKHYVIACTLILHGASIASVPAEYLAELLKYAAKFTHTAYSNDHEYRPIVGLLAIKVPEAVLDFSEDYEYPRLLRYYIQNGHMKVVNALLGAIQDPEKRKRILNYGDNSSFPLGSINYCKKLTDVEYLEGVKYLLEHGAIKTSSNVNHINLILQHAAREGHIETFKHFLNKADKEDFNTYIGMATIEGHMKIVKFLWKNYREYTVTHRKDTALHYAAWRGNLTSIKYLCENGASVNCKNVLGETPLKYARERGQRDIIDYLVSRTNS